MILPAALIIILLLYAVLFFYYLKGWRSLSDFTPPGKTEEGFISVIVAARNEERNISCLLKALSQQTYPKENFEIIIVDDFSSDGTVSLVKTYPLSNLLLVQPEVAPEYSSKKKAIETGIQQAKGGLIVTTDADCIPQKKWLESINAFRVQKKAAFIAAPVKFNHDNSFLQLFQSLDFLTLQGITAASVSSGFHMMCNGANLAYSKQAFLEVTGFSGIDKVATGDDMLLMHKIRKIHPGSIYYLKDGEAIVTTKPALSWKEFFMQRKRWASKTLIYDDYRIIAVLVFVYLLNCVFPALIVASCFKSVYWVYVLGFWFLKAAVEFPFVYSISKFYNEQKLVKFLFLFQPLHIFYTVFVGLASQVGKYEWKGRRTK